MDDLNVRTQRLYDLQKALIPQGIEVPVTVGVGVAPPTKLSSKNKSYRMPWISCTMFNDGPSPVYHTVNVDYMQTTTALNQGDSIVIDMKTIQPLNAPDYFEKGGIWKITMVTL